MTSTLYLSKALLCIASQCFPALVGADTPTGVFQLRHVQTTRAGYGGDVIVFHETPDAIYAIHRIPTFLPHRRALLASGSASDNRVTAGCINVADDVYDKLLEVGSISIRID